MNGRLNDQPLAELVQEICDARLSGVLRLARERAKGAVYFDGGRVAAALSNLRAFRLVEVLRRSGAADPARLYTLVGEGASDERVAVVLLRAGMLDEAALRKIQERQSKEVLFELLRWTDGEWSFDPRVRLAGLQQGRHLEVAALLAESARALPPEFVASRTRADERLAPVEGMQEKIESGLRLQPSEAFVLSRVYAPLRLGEVVAVAGLPEEETRRAVYVLALAGLLERPDRPRALPAEAVRQAAASQQQQRPAAAPEATAQESARQTGERAGPPEPEPVTEGTVEELFALARGATHYEVLGVARSATPEEVKRVYYAHARRLHPDRFRRDADEEQRQRIDAAFAKVTHAYETLKNTSLRAAYDLKLAKQNSRQ
jgi:DnaJ-domain-containing protein 1